MKITLSNGKELELLDIKESDITYQGTNRKSLILMFDVHSTTIEELIDNFVPENCDKIIFTNNVEKIIYYENYILRIELGCGYKDAIIYNNSSINTSDQVLYVKIAQATFVEILLQQHQEMIDDIIVSVLEGK